MYFPKYWFAMHIKRTLGSIFEKENITPIEEMGLAFELYYMQQQKRPPLREIATTQINKYGSMYKIRTQFNSSKQTRNPITVEFNTIYA